MSVNHKRATALHRRLAKVPADVRLNYMYARFSPTAVFTDPFATTAAATQAVVTETETVVATTPAAVVTPTVASTTAAAPATTADATTSTTPTVAAATSAAATTPVTTSATTDATTSTSATTSAAAVTTTSATTTAATTTSTTPVVVVTSAAATTSSATSTAKAIVTKNATATVVITPSLAASVTSSSAVASPTSTSSSSLSTGAVVGGIGAGIVGVAAIIFAIVFFVRRWRKRGADEAEFNANAFRRSAVLMDDPPTHADTVDRGYNPRPPTMIERRIVGNPSPAPTFGTQYGAPAPSGYGDDYAYGTQPGQVMYNPSMSPPPQTATSANPLFAYPQTAYSPMASPVSSTVGPYNSAYNDNGELVRQPSNAQYLTRQPSAPGLGRQASMASTDPRLYRQPSQAAHMPMPERPQYTEPYTPHNDYIDLSRSSVSPYQAAQYAEISRRLNTEVPGGLDTPAVNQFVDEKMRTVFEDGETSPPPPPAKDAFERDESPFVDPTEKSEPAHESAKAQVTPKSMPAPAPQFEAQQAKGDDRESTSFQFPAPPSPTHNRIDSTPPMLPEIHISQGYDFPSSPSPVHSGFPSGVSSSVYGDSQYAGGNRFPVTPSPLASSFVLPAPPPVAAGKGSFPGTPVERSFHTSTTPPPTKPSFTVPEPSSATTIVNEQTPTLRQGEAKRPNSVYTVYGDDEDAYGGF